MNTAFGKRNNGSIGIYGYSLVKVNVKPQLFIQKVQKSMNYYNASEFFKR